MQQVESIFPTTIIRMVITKVLNAQGAQSCNAIKVDSILMRLDAVAQGDRIRG